MKRFWTAAAAVRGHHCWIIELDGKPLRTPARAVLELPTEQLAQAVAAEWAAAGENVNPRAMPLTGLANAAVDRIAPDPKAFAQGLAKYAEADLTCYRAEGPSKLVEVQSAAWDTLLGQARRGYDVDFAVTNGLVHVSQPKGTIERLAHEVHQLAAFELAALSPLVTIGGSLVAALALIDGALSADDAWGAVSVDERWQIDQWGADPEAVAALDNRRRDFLAAARFLALLRD
ncbi:MAG: ATPase [Sphingomonas sp.]|nr:ATPase [Sphingomonas sp.]